MHKRSYSFMMDNMEEIFEVRICTVILSNPYNMSYS